MKAAWLLMMKYKKWLIIVVIIAAAVKGGLAYQASQTKQTVTTKTVKVERGDIVSTVSATGTIKPLNMVDISSKITGLIEELKVQENDTVKAGQELVVLDDTRLQAQASQAREKLNNAATNYERNQRLNQIGAVSDQQLDSSRLDYKVAQATYDDAVSQLSDTIIKAPIDGIVIGKPIPAGQTVAQGISNPMVILTIADMSKMQIETQVDETDIGKIAVGQTATFTVDAYTGKQFTGKVARISQKATVTSNVVYYTVVIDVDATDNLLKPTMTARVSIHSGESKNTLTLPLSALKSSTNGQYVTVSKGNGKTEDVAVTTGLSGEDRVEITGGISEGDQVVQSQVKASSSTPQTQQRGGGGIPGMGR
jgi:HlyD family secretion protein